MAAHISIQKKSGKHSIAKICGVLFIGICLIASALSIGLPHGSKAAGEEMIVKPAADTFVYSRQPDHSYNRSSHLDVRGDPAMASFLRFEIKGLGQGTVEHAHLRLFSIRDSGGKPVTVKLFATAADWNDQAVNWNQQPALGQPIAESAPAPIEKDQWIDLDLGQVVTGDGVYSFALTSDSSRRLSFRSSGGKEAPQLALSVQASVAPDAAADPAPEAAPEAGDDTDAALDAPAAAAPDAAALSTTAAAQSILVQVGTGYLAGAELAQRTQLATQGIEPYKSAVSNVISFANGKLSSSPKPQQPLNISGTTGSFVDDTATAYGLALAYNVTGNLKYAQKSRDFIMAWVQTTKSTSNTCPDSGSCQTSLIIGRVGPGFIFAAQLIKPSGAFSAADDQAFRTWLRNIILPTASTRNNNWGDAGTFLRVAVTDYLGDSAGFNAAIAKWKSLVDLIASDGHIPEETRRGSSGINYTQEALDYKIAVALIAQRRGLDLWSYGRFKQAVDYVAPYIMKPSAWPWASGASATIHPLWEIAYQRWRSAANQPIIAKRRPYGADGHSAVRWVTLTNGIPFN
jgi:hypothetical protein